MRVLKSCFLACVVVFVSLFFETCKSEDPPMSEEYFINTDSTKDNTKGLENFEKAFDNVAESYLSEIPKPIAALKSVGFMTASVERLRRIGQKRVKLMDSIGSIFDPAKCGCHLPDNVRQRIKSKKNFAPPFITNQLAQFGDSADYVPLESVGSVINTVFVKKGTKDPYPFPLNSAPGFENIDARSFLLDDRSSFFYTLDCSGYFTAAIEASAIVTVSGISSHAKTASKIQSSMFVGGGILASPVYSAMYNGILGGKMDTTQMLNILNTVVAIPALADADSVIVSSAFLVVWASNTGKSSFNGEADLSGRTGASFGVASFSASASAGGKVSRESTYKQYQTYVIDEERLTQRQRIKVADIKTRIQSLKTKPR